MPGADSAALLDNILRYVLRRASDELIIAKREPAGGRRRVGYVRAETFVFGHKAFQVIGHGLCIEACLVVRRRNGHTPPQREPFGTCVEAGGVRFFAIGIKDALDHLRGIEAGADLYPVSSSPPCGLCADDGSPPRRRP